MKKERGEAININDSRQFYSLQRQEREECKKENDDDEHTENVGGGSNSKLSSMPFGSYICSLHSSRLQFIVVVGKGCCVACGQKKTEGESYRQATSNDMEGEGNQEEDRQKQASG